MRITRLAISICALVIGLLVVRCVPQAKVFTLRDGSTLTVMQTVLKEDYGKKHLYQVDQSFLDPLHRQLPAPFKRFFPKVEAIRIESVSNSFVLWTRHNRIRLSPQANWRFVLFGEDGVQFDAGKLTSTRIASPWPREFEVEGWVIPTLPRNGNTLGVRIFEPDVLRSNSWKQFAEFLIPKPKLEEVPNWQPDPLPIVKRNDNIMCSLLGFATGIRDPALSHSRQIANLNEQSWTQVTLKVMENGRPGAEWEPTRLIISDRLGSHINFEGYYQEAPGIFTFSRPVGLWVNEAWKISVELAALQSAGTAFVWTVKGLKIPPNSSVAESQAITNRDGLIVRVLGIAAAGMHMKDGVPFEFQEPTLHAKLEGAAGSMRLKVVSARDAFGREIQMSGSFGSVRNESFAWGIELAPGVATMDVDFMLFHGQDFEFCAYPGKDESAQ